MTPSPSEPNVWRYVKDCLDTGQIGYDGGYVARFEETVAAFVRAKHGVALANGTAALHTALTLTGVQPGDYVLLPNLAPAAPAHAIRHCGAHPLLIDIHPGHWQMDLDLLEDFLSAHTVVNEQDVLVLKRDARPVRALMAVHLLGNMGDMERLLFIARRYHLQVVEDATGALGSSFRGRHAGTFGVLGCFGFHDDSLLPMGEGGILVTDDEALAQRAKQIITQAEYNLPPEDAHGGIGGPYGLVNVLAAIGVAQMEQLPELLKHSKALDTFYRAEWGGVGDIRFQEVPEGVAFNGGCFSFTTAHRQEVLAHLHSRQIQARPFWTPLNQLPVCKDCLYIRREDYAQRIHQTGLRLPFAIHLTKEEVAALVREVGN